MIDRKKPVSPGDLTAGQKRNTSVVLVFGSAASDLNFAEYKIFYKEGLSGVLESDSLWGSSSDANLSLANYNSATSTTITGLVSGRQYVFRIWAYDSYGHKASSSNELVVDLWSRESVGDWRWYQDQGSETPTISLAGLNGTPSDVASGQVIKLRLAALETEGIDANNVKLRLQYSTYSDFSSEAYWVGEIGSTSIWTYADGVDNDDDLLSTLLLSPTTTVKMTHNESGTSTSTADHAYETWAEWEFTLRNNGAATGTAYYFRPYIELTDEFAMVEVGQSFPSLITSAGSLSFIVSGLPSGTSTEGVSTNISTTNENIDFGQLSPGSQALGAHRFTVSTNAEWGYKLYVYSRSDFISNNGAVIYPVSATNESPAAWPAIPDPSSFGYHTGDDTLSGAAPSRFAANNTYARLESNVKEVGYSSIPVDEDVFDLIFRTEIGTLQPSGSFQTNIVYILTPEF
jgi:hypothetical protein